MSSDKNDTYNDTSSIKEENSNTKTMTTENNEIQKTTNQSDKIDNAEKNGSSNNSKNGSASSNDSTTTTKKKGKSEEKEKRRSHSRSFQTLHTGSKIKHLKKLDGEPLWRADIQYDFLAYIFFNKQAVFRNSYEPSETLYTFAEIYIDAMARSSKTSKILCEKLLGDGKAGLNMAMVCLLVNIGRMNTTLNFFPEMRAQLRTYHPIPSLQTYTDQSDYKQLQDAPRLKSILKGACEDRPEPSKLDQLEAIQHFPKTNPINLVFLVSTFANKVTEQFFTPPYEFHDLIMNNNLSSESRGRAFLWLMWTYLETNLTREELQKNPFGPGQEHGTKVPQFVVLTPEQLTHENVDPEAEIEFGNNMTRERKMYIDASQQTYTFLQPSTQTLANTITSTSGPKSAPSLNLSQTVATITSPIVTANGKVKLDMRRKASRQAMIEVGGSFVPILAKNKGDDDKSPSPAKIKLVLKNHHHHHHASGPNTGPGGGTVMRFSGPGAHSRDILTIVEIRKLIEEKDKENRRKRYKLGNIYKEWIKIKDHDPVYDSDNDDFPEVKTTGKSSQSSENKDDAPVVLPHKKRKRHAQTHDAYATPNANITESGPNPPEGSSNYLQTSYMNELIIHGSDPMIPLPTASNAYQRTGPNYGTNPTNPTPGGTLLNSKLPTKITVNNRLDFVASNGEDSVAMATAFRRSMRWLQRWDKPRREELQRKLDEMAKEREERLERMSQMEHEEYERLEGMFQEDRPSALPQSTSSSFPTTSAGPSIPYQVYGVEHTIPLSRDNDIEMVDDNDNTSPPHSRNTEPSAIVPTATEINNNNIGELNVPPPPPGILEKSRKQRKSRQSSSEPGVVKPKRAYNRRSTGGTQGKKKGTPQLQQGEALVYTEPTSVGSLSLLGHPNESSQEGTEHQQQQQQAHSGVMSLGNLIDHNDMMS